MKRKTMFKTEVRDTHDKSMAKPRWTRDGDQHVFAGTLGEYRITEWQMRHGPCFIVEAKLKGERRAKIVGEMSSLKNAKELGEQYDGYRSYQTLAPLNNTDNEDTDGFIA